MPRSVTPTCCSPRSRQRQPNRAHRDAATTRGRGAAALHRTLTAPPRCRLIPWRSTPAPGRVVWGAPRLACSSQSELRVPALGHGPRRSPCALLPFPQEERKLRTPQLSWVDTCSSRHKPAPRKSPVTGGYTKINNVGHRDLAEDPECVHVGTPLLAHIRYLLVWGTPQHHVRQSRTAPSG